MVNRRILASLFLGVFAIFTISGIYATTVITKSISQLTPEEYMKLAKYDPELGGYRLLDVADPTKLQKVTERNVQTVILTPLQVKEGPQFVVPGEFFQLKVTLKNVDNKAYQIAILQRPEPGVVDRIVNGVKSFFSNIYNYIVGNKPEEQVKNETWIVMPIYYLIAAIDPEQVISQSPTMQKVIRPGGLYETKPGYGCYDIVLMNEEQAKQVVEKITKGELSMSDLMCGKIDVTKVGPIEIPSIKSPVGPITVALPTQIAEDQQGKAYVAVKGDEVIAIYQGCTDKGDGEPYYQRIELGGKTYEIYIPSRPHDCILNPGESMTFTIYGYVNPIPSGTVPRDIVGEILSTLYTDPAKGKELMSKYPGAIHEVYFFLGKINDKDLGITADDIKKSIGSILTIGGGALIGFMVGGPIGAAAGALAGAIVNYLTIGSVIDLPVFKKAYECIYTGKCIYEVSSVKTMKTYLVISDLQVQVTVELVHLGILAILAAVGGIAGYRLAGKGTA